MDKGLKNIATPFTMEEQGFLPEREPEPTSAPVPVPVPTADEESQSGSYAAAGETAVETGIKSKSFLH